MCQQCYRISTDFTFVLFLLLERKGHAFVKLFTGSISFCTAVSGSKSCQSYNEIMGNGLPARMQKWLRSGQETGNLFGVALLSALQIRILSGFSCMLYRLCLLGQPSLCDKSDK